MALERVLIKSNRPNQNKSPIKKRKQSTLVDSFFFSFYQWNLVVKSTKNISVILCCGFSRFLCNSLFFSPIKQKPQKYVAFAISIHRRTYKKISQVTPSIIQYLVLTKFPNLLHFLQQRNLL